MISLISRSVSFHKQTVILLFIVFLIALALTGCQKDPNEEFIQGQWYDNSDHLANLPGESRQESFWLFEDGMFEAYGCCFTETHVSGYYRLIESEGDELVLELYNLEGYYGNNQYKPGDTSYVYITIDRQADSIRFSSGDPYTRVSSTP